MPWRRFGVSVTQRVPNLCCRNPKRCHCYSGASLTLSSMNTSGTCRQPAAWRQEKLREELPVDKQQAQGLLDQRSSQDSVYPFLVYDCCCCKLSHSLQESPQSFSKGWAPAQVKGNGPALYYFSFSSLTWVNYPKWNSVCSTHDCWEHFKGWWYRSAARLL